MMFAWFYNKSMSTQCSRAASERLNIGETIRPYVSIGRDPSKSMVVIALALCSFEFNLNKHSQTVQQ